MTKTLFSIFTILFATVLLYVSNVVSARGLPEWANSLPRKPDNSACVLTSIQHGYGLYLDLDSITVENYVPPYYQISASFCVLDMMDNTVVKQGKCVWKYIWSDYKYDRKLYDRVNDEEWQYIPAGKPANTWRASRLGGEIAWWKCYGIDFYGNPFEE